MSIGDDDVVVTDGHGAELTGLDDEGGSRAEGGDERDGVGCADRCGDEGGLLAEPLSQGSEVRLDGDVHQFARSVGQGLQRLAVELLSDQFAQLHRQVLPPGGGDERDGAV